MIVHNADVAVLRACTEVMPGQYIALLPVKAASAGSGPALSSLNTEGRPLQVGFRVGRESRVRQNLRSLRSWWHWAAALAVHVALGLAPRITGSAISRA